MRLIGGVFGCCESLHYLRLPTDGRCLVALQDPIADTKLPQGCPAALASTVLGVQGSEPRFEVIVPLSTVQRCKNTHMTVELSVMSTSTAGGSSVLSNMRRSTVSASNPLTHAVRPPVIFCSYSQHLGCAPGHLAGHRQGWVW